MQVRADEMRLASYAAGLAPRRLASAWRARGARGTVAHALRRLGTVVGHALTGPDAVQLSLLDFTCNHACPMCLLQQLEPAQLQAMKRADKAAGMRLADYRALFDAFPAGVREVNLIGGGEPLLHRDALEVMREVKDRGWRGSLVTNGTLLDAAAARAMVEMRWDQTRVSIHAGDPETYRRIQGVDRFETMLACVRGFDRLRREAGAEAACTLLVCHVIQQDNLAGIDRLFAVAEGVGADRIVFQLVIPRAEGIGLAADELARARDALVAGAAASRVPCNLDEILAQLAEAPEASAARAAPPAETAAPPPERPAAESAPPASGAVPAAADWVPGKRCSIGFDQSFVTAGGEVHPCCFSTEPLGRLADASFDRIWRSARYADFRRRLIDGRFVDFCITNRCSLPGVIQK